MYIHYKFRKLAICTSAIFFLGCQVQMAQTNSDNSNDGGGAPVVRTGTLEQNWQYENRTFTFEDGKYWGNTGCNDFSGTYKMISANQVEVMPMALTRKMCPDPEVMQNESTFATTFPGTYSIRFEGTTMILLNDKTSWVFGANAQ